MARLIEVSNTSEWEVFCLKIEKIHIHFNSDNLLIKSHTCHAPSFVDKSTLLQKVADLCLIT